MRISFSILLILYSFSFSAFSQHIPAIEMKMDSFEKALGFRGVVLIAKGDRILLHKGYGSIDKNTVFQIASVTKTFTGVAVLKLNEQGRLNLSDSIGKYFTSLPAASAGITIHQLLTHQSGLPQMYAVEGKDDCDDAAKAVFKIKLEADPGSKFIYSNGNYTLLALIIEKVTGGKWETYIEETILKPVMLRQTYFWSDKNKTGFPEIKSKKNIKNRKRDYGYLGSTGIFSTAFDLHTFLSSLNTNVLLSNKSRDLLLGKYIKLRSAFPNSTDYYAYGLFQTEGGINSYWTRGNEEMWGVSIAYHLPESGISVVVLSDTQNLVNGEKQHNYVSSQIIKALK